MNAARYIPADAVAMELTRGFDRGGFPSPHSWTLAPPVRFACDWRGENMDFARETEVRALWNNTFLYLRFLFRYRTLTVFADSDVNRRPDQLCELDVPRGFPRTRGQHPR